METSKIARVTPLSPGFLPEARRGKGFLGLGLVSISVSAKLIYLLPQGRPVTWRGVCLDADRTPASFSVLAHALIAN